MKSDKERFKDARMVSIFGIIGNIFLMIIKGIIGFATNSQSMIADFVNSVSDIFSSLLTFIGNKIASKPQDDEHNLGHGKAEYIFSFLISIGMIYIAYTTIKNSLLSIINKQASTYSIWLIVVTIVTIIVKFLLFVFTDKISKKYNNILVEANAKDHRNDCLVALVNMVSILFSKNGFYFADGIGGIAISIYILYCGIDLFRRCFDILMDTGIDEDKKDEVIKIIKSHDEIKKYQHFNSTPVGYKYQISISIFVDGNMSTFESHKIADDLEKEIVSKVPEIYLAIIHVNPI